MTFDIGLDRGFISSMITLERETSCCMSTMNGYLMLFDLRNNLLLNSYKINDDNSPIHCL